ncbi:hypothetical protein V1511DRAFT_503460 [Dipodascopsis uninucleata]
MAPKKFVVPESMPDGIHRRKLEKIKKNLDHNAKVKRSYRKTLAKMGLEPMRGPAGYQKKSNLSDGSQIKESMGGEDLSYDSDVIKKKKEDTASRQKLSRFKRQETMAMKRKFDIEAKKKEIAQNELMRKQKLEQRDRMKKKMNQFNRTGQPKLGARVNILLDKIQRTDNN